MKPAEIRAKSVEELRLELTDAQEELSNLRFRSAGEQNNPIRLRLMRRQVAQLKTVLREHELGISTLAARKPNAQTS